MAAPLLLAALGSQKKKTKTKSAGLGSLLTGRLGGGEDDEDDGSTLVSLAGSLLGGRAEKEDGGDLLTSLAGGLLTNALGGGSGKKIDVSAAQEDGKFVIRVRDYGAGIPEEELPFVKQKFYKGSSRARGSGIGLAVCDEIVRLHGGTFDIGNAEGGGAVVTIALPMA